MCTERYGYVIERQIARANIARAFTSGDVFLFCFHFLGPYRASQPLSLPAFPQSFPVTYMDLVVYAVFISKMVFFCLSNLGRNIWYIF